MKLRPGRLLNPFFSVAGWLLSQATSALLNASPWIEYEWRSAKGLGGWKMITNDRFMSTVELWSTRKTFKQWEEECLNRARRQCWLLSKMMYVDTITQCCFKLDAKPSSVRGLQSRKVLQTIYNATSIKLCSCILKLREWLLLHQKRFVL